MEQNKKINIAIIGLGYLGKFHFEKFSKLQNVNITGISDINQENLNNFNKYNFIKTTNYKELLPYVDAVSIVTPTNTHFEIAKFFLENKKHVLVEKPMTSSVEEASKLIDIAKKNNLILQVGHLERFNPAIVACQEYLGTPMFIESLRISQYSGRSTDIDVIRDLMIHDIDIILNIVKSKIKSIHAVGVPILTNKIDIANARLIFDSGCVVNITSSRVSLKKERKIRIFQDNRYISIDYDKKLIKIFTLNKKNGKEILNTIDFLKSFRMKRLKFKENVDQLQKEIKAFIDSIIHNKPPVVSGEDGKNALEVALKILKDVEVNLNDTICRYKQGI